MGPEPTLGRMRVVRATRAQIEDDISEPVSESQKTTQARRRTECLVKGVLLKI